MLARITGTAAMTLPEHARSAAEVEGEVARHFREQGAAIYRFSRALLRDHQDAEDVVQETFLKLLSHLRARGDESNLRGWLFTVAAHACRDRQRFRLRWRPWADTDEPAVEAVVDTEAGPGERAHVAGCESCAARVRGQQGRLDALLSRMDRSGAMPARLETRVRAALEGDAGVRGSTTLRGETAPAAGWRRGGWRAALATAAALVLVMVLGPRLNGPPTV